MQNYSAEFNNIWPQISQISRGFHHEGHEEKLATN